MEEIIDNLIKIDDLLENNLEIHLDLNGNILIYLNNVLHLKNRNELFDDLEQKLYELL